MHRLHRTLSSVNLESRKAYVMLHETRLWLQTLMVSTIHMDACTKSASMVVDIPLAKLARGYSGIPVGAPPLDL